MRVKPASENLLVRDPERKGHLPAEGAEVPDTEYWRRRLADGDVVAVTEAAKTKPEKKD